MFEHSFLIYDDWFDNLYHFWRDVTAICKISKIQEKKNKVAESQSKYLLNSSTLSKVHPCCPKLNHYIRVTWFGDVWIILDDFDVKWKDAE